MGKQLIHRRFVGVNVIALTALAGLLIWAKLRLVTDFPRTVQADPPSEETGTDLSDESKAPPTHLRHEPLPSNIGE